jgi:hypothetical protein
VPVPASNASLIAANDNRRPGGERSGNVLQLRLVVDEGRWQPEGPDGRTLFVQAFRLARHTGRFPQLAHL